MQVLGVRPHRLGAGPGEVGPHRLRDPGGDRLRRSGEWLGAEHAGVLPLWLGSCLRAPLLLRA